MMNETIFQPNWNLINSKNDLSKLWLKVLAVLLLLSPMLLMYNMEVNEQDLLPLAKQYADPSWIPNDWYLNQPPSYRFLFQAIFGNLINFWGFLATSIIGRLFCYVLVASGLVLIGQQLGLRLIPLLLAISLFLYLQDFRVLATRSIPLQNSHFTYLAYCFFGLAIGATIARRKLHLSSAVPLLLFAIGLLLRGGGDTSFSTGWTQGVAAGEWIVGGLEAKSVAYGFVLIAIGLMLRQSYHWTALLLGVATSFHVLVGGYTFLAVVGWISITQRFHFRIIRKLATFLLLYLLGSLFAIKPVLEQLFVSVPTSVSTGNLSPSYIYVFWRLPHHLYPLVWKHSEWLNTIIHLVLLVLSFYIIQSNSNDDKSNVTLPKEHSNRVALFQFTLICLVAFLIGVIAAPFDAQGKLLQYYPFRLGDVLLPLSAWLLFACALQQSISKQKQKVFLLVSAALVALSFSIQLSLSKGQMSALNRFPSVASELKDVCAWVRENTPKATTVISSPLENEEFSWLSERATIAKFKFLPQTKAGILEWYERLVDLSGGTFSFPTNFDRGFSSFKDIAEPLSEHYGRLTTAQIEALEVKYNADYFLTHAGHRVDQPIAYQNQAYILYKKN
jgi:hypothetical protein